VSLVDRIEALARTKGWHTSQSAHGYPDGWQVRSDIGGISLWRDGTHLGHVRAVDAALWILLAVSGLPDVDVGRCRNACRLMPDGEGGEGRFYSPAPTVWGAITFARRCNACTNGRDRRSPAQLVLDASRSSKRSGSGIGGQSSLATEVDHEARDALAQLASRLRDEALVLADHWQADGVGYSTQRILDGMYPDMTCREGCGRRSSWLSGRDGDSVRFQYCHEHRPRDGYGYHLAVAIRIDDPYEVPPEHSPGREHGADGHSPMLWRLIERWLDPSEYAAGLRDDLSDALGAALQRVRGAADPVQPVHVRLDQALRAGRTWMVLEPGDVAPGQRTIGLARPRQDLTLTWAIEPHRVAVSDFPEHEEFTFDVRWYNDGSGAGPLAVLRGTRLPGDVQALMVAPPR
jgi:hypothetical protein